MVSYRKISEKRHKLELFSGILVINMEKALTRCFRNGFYRMVYVERKRNVLKYAPQLHVLNILEQHQEKQDMHFDCNLEEFYNVMDAVVEEKAEE